MFVSVSPQAHQRPPRDEYSAPQSEQYGGGRGGYGDEYERPRPGGEGYPEHAYASHQYDLSPFAKVHSARNTTRNIIQVASSRAVRLPAQLVTNMKANTMPLPVLLKGTATDLGRATRLEVEDQAMVKADQSTEVGDMARDNSARMTRTRTRNTRRSWMRT